MESRNASYWHLKIEKAGGPSLPVGGSPLQRQNRNRNCAHQNSEQAQAAGDHRSGLSSGDLVAAVFLTLNGWATFTPSRLCLYAVPGGTGPDILLHAFERDLAPFQLSSFFSTNHPKGFRRVTFEPMPLMNWAEPRDGDASNESRSRPDTPWPAPASLPLHTGSPGR